MQKKRKKKRENFKDALFFKQQKLYCSACCASSVYVYAASLTHGVVPPSVLHRGFDFADG